MDTIQQIVGKALKGEDYAPLMATMTDDEKVKANLAIRDAADSAAKTELDKVSGIRKERERLEKPNEQKADETFKKFADEQRVKAKNKFFADKRFTLTDDEKAQVEAEFAQRGSDKVDADLIFSDYVKAYASVKSDFLIGQQEEAEKAKKGAQEFMAGQAQVNYGVSQPDDQKYTQAAKDLMKDWNKQGLKGKTLDEAQALVNRGFDWKKRSLSS